MLVTDIDSSGDCTVSVLSSVPAGADVTQLEAAVLRELGDHTHSALRGPTAEVRYFNHLLSSALPYLLPPHQIQSR